VSLRGCNTDVTRSAANWAVVTNVPYKVQSDRNLLLAARD
jgi:hypothetical protein